MYAYIITFLFTMHMHTLTDLVTYTVSPHLTWLKETTGKMKKHAKYVHDLGVGFVVDHPRILVLHLHTPSYQTTVYY